MVFVCVVEQVCVLMGESVYLDEVLGLLGPTSV